MKTSKRLEFRKRLVHTTPPKKKAKEEREKMETHKDTRRPPRGVLVFIRPSIRARFNNFKPTIPPIVPGKFKTRGGGCLIQEARAEASENMKTGFGAANQPGKFDEDNKFTSETRTGQDCILPRQEPKNLDSNCANIVARPIVLGKFETRGGGCLVQESRAEAREKMETHKDTRRPPRGVLVFIRPSIRARFNKEKKPTIPPVVPGKFKTRGGGCLIQEARAEASENMKTDFGAANQPGKFDRGSTRPHSQKNASFTQSNGQTPHSQKSPKTPPTPKNPKETLVLLPSSSMALANNDSKEKKEKRMTKKVVLEEEVPVASIKMEKKQKRKADERSETVSELGKSLNLKSSEAEKKNKKAKVAGAEKKNKKAKVAGEDEDEDEVTKFSISAPLREKLKANGIKVLLPIQATMFNQILDGYDLVCRAHTDQEKTLAFVLPILESLINGHAKGIRYKNRGYGRPPRVLVLLPTRKRASQVFDVFKVYGGSLGLASCYICGAATCTKQEQYVKRGVDIVVGTPGHVKDLLEKGSLNLSSLKFRVLDEADEMLRMGFAKDVELILVKAGMSKVQTLLFSATFPQWVRKGYITEYIGREEAVRNDSFIAFATASFRTRITGKIQS